MITLPPRSKLIEYDLKRSLIHECGHLIVGDHVGVEKSFAKFWLYEDADPANEHLVGGQSSYFPPLYDRENQLMGIAGFVAEMLDSDEESIDGEELSYYWDDNVHSLSATDLEAAGEVDVALFDDCSKLLRQHWSDLIDEAIHFLGQFEDQHSDDEDVALAVPLVRLELEGMRNRFEMAIS